MNKSLLTIAALSFWNTISVVQAQPVTRAAKPESVGRCPVHKIILKEEWVKIEYGLIHWEKEYAQARQELFPYSNKTRSGGCVVTNHSPKFAKVSYCSKCRSAEYLWKKQHPAKETLLNQLPKPIPPQPLPPQPLQPQKPLPAPLPKIIHPNLSNAESQHIVD